MGIPPPDARTDGLLGQILLEQGKISRDIGIILEQLKAVPDHELRLRSLEETRAQAAGESAASKDYLARWLGVGALIASWSAAAAAYFHH